MATLVKVVCLALVSTFALAACSSPGDTATAGAPRSSVDSGAGLVAPPPRDPAIQELVDEVGLQLCPTGVENPDAALPGLPNIELPCLGDGPSVNLSTLRGTPLVINVWASWCPPCIEEMPILTQAARELAGEVSFIGIDYQDDPVKGLMLLDRMDVDFPSVVDTDAKIRGPLAIPGPPVTFFVRPDGTIAGRWDGVIPGREALATMLSVYLGITW